MSQRTYQEIMEARAARALRAEAQLISAALFDDAPHQSIDKGYLNPAWLSKTQRVFSNAITMCGGAHLRVLRAFDKKIYDLATQSMPAPLAASELPCVEGPRAPASPVGAAPTL